MQKLNHLYLVKQYVRILLLLIVVSVLFSLVIDQLNFEFDAFFGMALWISAMWWVMTSTQETLLNNQFLATLPLSRKSIFRSRYICCMLCVSLTIACFGVLGVVLALIGLIEGTELMGIMVRCVFALAFFSLIFAISLSSNKGAVRISVTLIGGIIVMSVQANSAGTMIAMLLVGAILAALSLYLLFAGERRFCQMDLD